MAIKCGNCGEYHQNVQAVRGCHLAAGIIKTGATTRERCVICGQWMEGAGYCDNCHGYSQAEISRNDLSDQSGGVVVVTEPDPWWDDSATRVSQRSNFLDDDTRVYLNVPFKDKDFAKQEFGAKWDARARKWWVGQSVLDVRKDIPESWMNERKDAEPISEDGIYVFEGETYKIQWNRDETHLYGKRMIVEGNSVFWRYEAGIPMAIAGARKLTLEEAKEFGKLYGSCIVCSRKLTNEESIVAGIGPICAGRL